jgi:hypothetical protein
MNWQPVEAALGAKGSAQPGDVYKFSLPRTDLTVTLDGTVLKPGLALGTWLAFKPHGQGALLMGDLVLTVSELNAVLERLIANDIRVTAIHNHLLRTDPAIMYLHVESYGDPVMLAKRIRAALAASRTPIGGSQPPAGPTASTGLDTQRLDQILGRQGKTSGGVYQFSIPRAEPIRMDGMDVPPAMGTAIVINFQPLGDGQAATTGDFVLLDKEVNPVIQALKAKGLEVTALHNHMLTEQPRLFYLHFWGKGDPQHLAQGLRAALAEVGIQRK